MTTLIAIPDSVRDYLTNETICSVVEHLLEQKDQKLPPDLRWDKVRAYHEAWLSAQKVKTDYALLLMDLWDAIWRPALENYGVDIENQSWDIEEMKEYEAEPSRHVMWNDGTFRRWFRLKTANGGFSLDTGVVIDSDEDIYLLFRVDDDEQEILPAEETLFSQWQFYQGDDDDGNFFQTPSKLIRIQANTQQLDISALVTLADEAVAKFVEFTGWTA